MKARVLLLAPLAAALGACATNPAEDPVQIKLNDVDTRLGRVERVISNQSLVDLSRRVDTLEGQSRDLRGSTEVLQNGSEALHKQQRDLYADLDKRIAALEGGARVNAAGAAGPGATAGRDATTGGVVGGAGTGSDGPIGAGSAGSAGAGAATGSAATPVVDEQGAYTRAFDQLKSGEYHAAAVQFQAFMERYPQSTLLDNAQYWIGESYYVTRDYDQAAAAFKAVGERWPASRKAPDALLKLGFTQYEQKHLRDARATLTQVTQRFPGTDAARLATERLQKLPAEGR